jgi:lycopene cyclase CruA
MTFPAIPATGASPRDARRAPDLSYFKQHYPSTVAHFGTLAERERWLRRIWELDERWRQEAETHGGRPQTETEAVVRGRPPAGAEVEDGFDIVYAGGAYALFHAALMACRYERRVLVCGEALAACGTAATAATPQPNWNISGEDLGEFERAGLFTKEELEAAVVNRYERGFVKFYDAASRVKAERLWMSGVLDVAIDADRLLALAAARIRAHGARGCALVEGLKFVRAYVEPDRVTVEVRDARGARRFFGARLFVDATAANSPVAQQLNEGRALTHVRPTVGTVARGFMRGEEPDKVNFNVGEILVSTEDASESRQLMWESFAGSPQRDEYATYLFFYDALSSPADKSLLALFERYFESLPGYKRAGAQWRVERPVFGYLPGAQPRGWRRTNAHTAADRVVLLGDAAGVASPLTLSGFGTQLRSLRQSVHLTELALAADLVDAASLAEIGAPELRVAQVASLAEFLRPAPKSAPSTVNETLNAVMAALHNLDERVRRDLFQDRMTFSGLKSLLSHTVKLYPRIFGRVREHMGARGTFWWLAHIAEAVWRERRQPASPESLPEERGQQEEAAQKFTRFVALYKKGDGADDPS